MVSLATVVRLDIKEAKAVLEDKYYGLEVVK
jgi:hypothetical protein